MPMVKSVVYKRRHIVDLREQKGRTLENAAFLNERILTLGNLVNAFTLALIPDFSCI